MATQVSFQLVSSKPRNSQICGSLSNVQGAQDARQLGHMVRAHPLLCSATIESLKSLVAKANDHRCSISRNASRYPRYAIAAKHGCYRLRGVANYQDVYRLTYVRGPSGIIVILAQALAGRWHR